MEKLKEASGKKADVRQTPNRRNGDELSKKNGKESDIPLTNIPQPPPPFPHRLKNKEDKGKFSKFMAMIK